MSENPLPSFPPGTVINDRYAFVRKLGNDGHVYEAHDRHLDRKVAVKLLDPIIGEASRSWAEAQRLEALRSKCLIEVLNADVDGLSDIRFIVTPLVSGGDLEAQAKGLGLGLHRAVQAMRHVAAGVDRIHGAGMVHRDIKPGNALICGDYVVVSDLGYCAILDEDGAAPPNGSWCTVAPEVAAGGSCSVASDVYSLGATAFFVLAGQYPVDLRKSQAQQRDLIIAGELRELRDLAPHVPQSVATVVRRSLKHDPSQRHTSAEDFANSLATAIIGRRDWTRVSHPEHAMCVHGESFQQRGEVLICGELEGPRVRIVARNVKSNRRVRGTSDRLVTAIEMASEIRKMVTSLSS